MRNDDVRTLFDYNYWANQRLLDHAAQLSDAQFAAPSTLTVRGLRATLVHALDVEWSWRLRLQRRPAEEWGPDAELTEKQFPTVAALAERWHQDERDMRAYLATLSDAGLNDTLDLGPRDRFPLWYFLMHILQHSAQQRADAATLLTQYGRSPGEFDFLEFTDTRNAAQGDEQT
jgi:uncharacterized damage-inducible protein DinB